MQRSASRVTSACRNCKQRRAKCDGARPTCTRCRGLSRECTYDGVDHRKSRHTHAEFSALHNRIAYLEQQVKLLMHSQNTVSDNPDVRPTDVAAEPTESAVLSPLRLSLPQTQQPDDLASFPWDILDTASDWIVELPPLPWSEDKKNMVRSLLSRRGSQLDFDCETGKMIYVGPTSNHHLVGTREVRLPPRSEAAPLPRLHTFDILEQHLFQSYRDTVQPTFPLFYDGPGNKSSPVVHLAASHPLLLYIVLALGAFFLKESVTVQLNVSQEILVNHYTEGFTNISGPELENCSFQNVRAFLLRAYLDILRGKLASATIYNSIGCAMAKRLGLHVDCTTDISVSEQQERRSLFWATLWLDRRLALLEGRACQIDHSDISCSRPLSILSAQPGFSDLPVSLELIYACQVEIHCLQDVTLQKLYSFSNEISKADAISDGHLKLISWFASLPASMKDVNGGKTFHPSFLSFHMCFHSGLILIHRRSLSDDGKAAELSNKLCEESAGAISSLLKTYNEQFCSSLSDPMVLHAAFTSALVHLVLLLQPNIVTYRSALKALRSTKQILLNFAATSSPASRILNDLQELATKWEIAPANSPTFWNRTSLEPNPVDLTFLDSFAPPLIG